MHQKKKNHNKIIHHRFQNHNGALVNTHRMQIADAENLTLNDMEIGLNNSRIEGENYKFTVNTAQKYLVVKENYLQ